MSEEAKAAFEKWKSWNNYITDLFELFQAGYQAGRESAEVLFTVDENQVESVINENKKLQAKIDKLTVCQCSEMDVEFNRHCNSCVKDRIEKLQAKLAQAKKANDELSERLESKQKIIDMNLDRLTEAEKVIDKVEKDKCREGMECRYKEECFCAIEIAREYQRKYKGE